MRPEVLSRTSGRRHRPVQLEQIPVKFMADLPALISFRPPDLLDSLADENVVLFLGSDAPLGFANGNLRLNPGTVLRTFWVHNIRNNDCRECGNLFYSKRGIYFWRGNEGATFIMPSAV